jgi:hypothetical protein
MKTNKFETTHPQENWRQQIFTILMNKLPNANKNTCEEEYWSILNFIELIKFYADDLQKYIIWGLLESDFEERTDYRHILLRSHRKLEAFKNIKQKDVPKLNLNNDQLKLIENVIGFILAHHNDHQPNPNTNGFERSKNSQQKNHKKKYQGGSIC